MTSAPGSATRCPRSANDRKGLGTLAPDGPSFRRVGGARLFAAGLVQKATGRESFRVFPLRL